tara:strand:- start:3619 stop:4680 length:1062 start_codon:yes stop_codon:yes gene_type:complete
MKKILLILFLLPLTVFSQSENGKWKDDLKKVFKFSTFYGAVNGGNSISDVDVFSVTNGLETNTVSTPFDYSVTLGVRKIARFGYEPKERFKNGKEYSFSDAATVGKIPGFEFLFEADYKRQQGENYLDQNHFLRYVADKWIAKVEYLEDGFADIKYFEASQRYRHKLTNKFSLNIGAVQRLSEPYGYDPLEEWLLVNGNLHYTYLAIQEGYEVDFSDPDIITYSDPNGSIVATNTDVWEAVVIPTVLSNYTERKRNQLSSQIEYSVVVGFDYYHYTSSFWLHSWGNLMPYHIDTGNEFSYHNYNQGQWLDYSGGLIFGYKLNRHLGFFLEGKYNKYWNRKWHDFSVGVNYIIF